MPTSSGPNIQHGSNLVFDYDTGDVVNSYIGEPTTNLLSSYFNTDYVMVGSEFSQYADLAPIFNTYGYGPSYTYSLSLDMKVNKNGSVLVYMQNGSYTKYSFVYQSVNATTEYQRFTFPGLNANLSTPSETLAILAFYTGYGSGVTPTVKNVQVELKPHATPYIKGTRSATQGLLDISGRTNTVNLSSVSFDSAAQPYFDGTDDSLVISNSDALKNNNTSIEFIIMYTNTPNGDIVQFGVGSGAYAQYYYRAYSGNSYWVWYPPNSPRYSEITIPNSAFTLNRYHHVVMTGDSTGNCAFYINGVAQSGVSNVVYSTPSSWTPANLTVGGFSWDGYSSSKIPLLRIYNTVLTTTQIQQNYNSLKQRFNLPNVPYIYSEGANANLYTANWNNSTTYTMADFGGLPNVTAHGFSSGPVTYTLTLNALPPHTRVRYKVFWHLVDSLDNETNQLFLSTSSGESEILRFTKVYNSAPNISVAASPGTYTWSGPKTYTYRPWANGYYNQDGYIIVDSGYIDHTASTFTARHVMGADQAQADEAEYLSHVEVEISG